MEFGEGLQHVEQVALRHIFLFVINLRWFAMKVLIAGYLLMGLISFLHNDELRGILTSIDIANG